MNRILFFLPFWFDHIYSDFDPWNDKYTSDANHNQFLWEISENVPVDGFLFSRTNLEKSQVKFEGIKKAGGIRNHLKIPEKFLLFGDCGAFGYIDKEIPPYDSLEMIDFYERMQFNLGCTVDHLIVKATEDQRYQRQNLTLKNAEKMFEKWNSGDFSYKLVGVAQGWDPFSYHESVKAILDMNFEYIAFGGLVRSQSKSHIQILKTCYPLWRGKDVKIHVFGVAREKTMPAYRKFRITSFDNAYHRRAWMSNDKNYRLMEDGYTALRIPLSNKKKAAWERIEEEQFVFDILRDYINRKAKPEDVIDALRIYEQKLVEIKVEKQNRFSRLKNLEENYLRTLKERPWEKCFCPICKVYGVHVCIFRTNNRNMRRGFHNLFQFYKRLQDWLKGEIQIENQKLYDPVVVENIPVAKLKKKKVLIIASHDLKNKEIKREKDQHRFFKLVEMLVATYNWDYIGISPDLGLVFPKNGFLQAKAPQMIEKENTDTQSQILLDLSKILPNYTNILLLTDLKDRKLLSELMDGTFIHLKAFDFHTLCLKIEKVLPSRSLKLLDFI